MKKISIHFGFMREVLNLKHNKNLFLKLFKAYYGYTTIIIKT